MKIKPLVVAKNVFFNADCEGLALEALNKNSRLDEHKEIKILGSISHSSIRYVAELIKRRSEILERTMLSQDKNWQDTWNNGIEYYIEDYAKSVIKGRWIEAEKKILETEVSYCHVNYAQNCIRNRWPELEKKIIDNIKDKTRIVKLGYEESQIGIYYAERVIKNRWPELEQKLLKFSGDNSNWVLVRYAADVVKSEWPELEKKIIKESDAAQAFEYCKYAIKDRNRDLENLIYSNYVYPSKYKSFIRTKIEKHLKNKNYDEILKYCDYKEYSSIIKNLYKKYFIPDTLRNSILAQSLVGDKESLKTLQEDKLFKTKVKCLIEELLANNSISETSTTKDILRVL
jgi:hypothetical protein